MRVTLSVDHMIAIVSGNKLELIPELNAARPNLMQSYAELTRLGAFDPSIIATCTACAKKNIGLRKYSLLTTAVLALNIFKDRGSKLEELMAVLSEMEGQKVTQLDLMLPAGPNTVNYGQVRPQSQAVSHSILLGQQKGNTIVTSGVSTQ